MRRLGRWAIATGLIVSSAACGSRDVKMDINPDELDPATREQMELMIRSREDPAMMAPGDAQAQQPAPAQPAPQ